MSASPQVAPHGLLGQTFDGDGVAIDGAIDDYSAKVVVTKAMGEGAIEGVAADYELPSASPFSTKFKCGPIIALLCIRIPAPPSSALVYI